MQLKCLLLAVLVPASPTCGSLHFLRVRFRTPKWPCHIRKPARSQARAARAMHPQCTHRARRQAMEVVM